jgi:FtsP/CotA-like multicopper oxidase with cupredoxin domain
MDHPFHLHGFFFQLLERDGEAIAADRVTDEDTVVVPSKSSMLFVTRLDEPGMWPYHCHILEHAEAGMLGMIEVGE